MLKLGVLVSGGGTNLQAIIDAVAEGKIRDTVIEVVISNKEDAYALERAKNSDIKTNIIHNKEELLKVLDKYDVDLIVLAGFLMVLPKDVIEKYSKRIINVHPSLIPSFCGHGYYGLKVHEEAIKRGVKVTGATVHFVDEGCDTGPIIMQKAVEVHENDTPSLLQKRVMEEAEWVILPIVIDRISSGEIKIGG